MPDKQTQTETDVMESIAAALEEIRHDTKRNADVANLYGSRAKSIFALADRISNIMSHFNPMLMLPTLSLKN